MIILVPMRSLPFNLIRLLTSLFIVATVACQNSSGAGDATEPTVAIPTTAPIITRDSSESAGLDGTPEPASTEKYTLNVWVDTPLKIGTDDPGAALIREQIATFDASHPDINVDIQVKQIAGAGGSLDYLRSGRGVADDVLPDVVLLPVELLPIAAAEQLIFPLDSYFDDASFYPAAATLSRVGDVLYGYPIITTNVRHFVYTNNILDGDVPTRWDELVSNEQVRLIFAADGNDATLLLLEQYIASGGQISAETDSFSLQTGPLTKALGRISAGKNSETIVAVSAETTNSAQALNNLRQGIANSALISASDYRTELQSNSAYSAGPIPGGDAAAAQLVSAWAWAITTPDAVEQQLSADFIRFMSAPENLGAWTFETAQIPAQSDAMTTWPNPTYATLLDAQLSAALPYPQNLDGVTATVLQQAVTNLLENGGDVTTLSEEIIGRITQQ